MKHTIFSPKLYKQSLSRVLPLGIAMMVTIILINIFLPVNGMMRNDDYDRFYYNTEPEYVVTDDYTYSYTDVYDVPPKPQEIRETAFAPALWALVAFAPLMVHTMFSFLNDRKKSDFYHALPQTRVCVYLSMIAAVFTWFAATILLSVGINTLLWSFAKYYTFTASTVFSNILFYSILAVFMSGFAAVAMMITGTEISGILIYGFLLIFPTYAFELFRECVTSVSYFFARESFQNVPFSIDHFLLLAFDTGNGELTGDLLMLVYSFVIGTIMFILAGVLYHFRRSETAKRSAPSNLLQHIYRIVFSTAVAILLPTVLIWGDEELSFFVILVTIIVYVLYELMTTKKVKKMVRSLPLLIVPFLLSGVFVLSVYGVNAYGIATSPKAQNIESITFTDLPYFHNSYITHAIIDHEITDEEAIQITADSMQEYIQNYDASHNAPGNSYTVKFRTKNGKTITRYFHMSDTNFKNICLINDVSKSYDTLPSEIVSVQVDEVGWYGNINAQTAWKIYQEEYALLSKEEKFICAGGKYFIELDGMAVSDIAVRIRAESRYYTLNFLVSPKYTPKTFDYLVSAHGSEKEILNTLNLYKEKGKDVLVTLSYQYKEQEAMIHTNTQMFFSYVAIDEHLFQEHGGVDVVVKIDGVLLHMQLTFEELDAIREVSDEFFIVNEE